MGSKNKTSKGNKKVAKDSSQVGEDKGKRDVVTDPRFAHVHYDPRFARARKQKTKVAIDSRFDRMFTDKNFSSSSVQVDKRGKPKKKDGENPLEHYYRLEEDESRIKEVNSESESASDNDEGSESESDYDELKRLNGKVQETKSEDDNEDEDEDDNEDEVEDEDEDEDDNEDEVEDAESDRSSADTTDDEEDVYLMEHDNVEQEEKVPEIDKETQRLGVVNLDWNHVRAVDIFMLFTSFLPKGGHMLSVSVYPSEFGLKRMEEEAVHGPVGLFDDNDAKKDDSEDDDDDDDDDENDGEIDDEKLRAYELSRLRYYFAVVECDSVATADYLYKTCDGLEFERSSNQLDLRFIPDSMEFKHPPRDVATEAPSKYEGIDFHSKALQLSNIDLTWDEDEPQRSKSLKRKFNDAQLADMELKEFLASDDSESESDNPASDDDDDDDVMEHKPEKKRKKQELYRSLLQSGNDSENENDDDNKGDMEVTFNTGLEELSKRHLEKKDKESETVWEAYLRKKKEKKKAKKNRSKNSSDDESSGYDEESKQDHADDFFVEEPSKKQKVSVAEAEAAAAEAGRAELELLLANDDETNTSLKGYNMKHKKKSKGKKNNLEEIQEDEKLPNVDYEDPRFSSLFTSPLFALDPTDPQFKRSAAYTRQLAQKQGKSGREVKVSKRERNKEVPEPVTVEKDHSKVEEPSKKKDKLELSSLVKSLKMKSQQFQMPSKNKAARNGKTRK